MLLTYSSLAINDPNATYRVITAHNDIGFGVYGYYDEFTAHAVERDLRKAGYECRIEPHSMSTLTGVHPAILTGRL